MSSFTSLRRCVLAFVCVLIGLIDTDIGRSLLVKHVQAYEVGETQKSFGSHNTKKVAIIGAGAAGASTAFHVRRFADAAGVDVTIDVFEKASYVGGRSTTVNAWDNVAEPVELGASIFVKVNRILMEAKEEFGLHEAKNRSDSADSQLVGIWDGRRFVYTQDEKDSNWWTGAKLFWKYGMSPIRASNLMKAATGSFFQLYDAPFFPFRSLTARVRDLGMLKYTTVTGDRLLRENKISEAFSNDIIQAATRVNYASNIGVIHGLETAVCLAIEGAMQIKGGNWQIFDKMLNSSGANLHLNTSINSISKEERTFKLDLSSQDKSSADLVETEFDTVVLAAPLQYSEIKVQDGLVKHLPEPIPYVHLYTTLFASPLTLNTNYFGLEPTARVPETILTTLGIHENPYDRDHGSGSAGFLSISRLRTTINPISLRVEYLYKIFSLEAVTASLLGALFNTTLPDDLSNIAEKRPEVISWYYPHIWNSYPKEYPRVTFDDPVLANGFYYTSGIEPFISTMETSALMGKNVAQLIMDDYLEVLKDDEHSDFPREL